MRKLVLAAFAALCISLPAFAQSTFTSGDPAGGISASLVIANDNVMVKAEGRQWATVVWTVSTAGSGAITTEYTSDRNLNNWLPAPYTKRLDQVSSNPTIQTWANTTPVAGTYETPLPGNAVAFRIRYQTAGTATTIFLSAGTAYNPGDPITATLLDITEGSIGAGIAAQVLDIAGWNATAYSFTTPTTQVWSLKFLDSTGATVLPTVTTTAASSASITLSPDATSLTTMALPASTLNALGIVWPRVSVSLPAGGTVSTGRVIVFARR
jgi:hypothetical protein